VITRIYRKDVIKDVPKRWANQYDSNSYYGQAKSETTKKLLSLISPFTAVEVNEIIGNDSWTKLLCTECNENCESVVRIGDEPEYDARWVDLCDECLEKARFA
jgi:hypothetical protein